MVSLAHDGPPSLPFLVFLLLQTQTPGGGPTALCLLGKSPKMEFGGKERNLLFNGKFLTKISG